MSETTTIITTKTTAKIASKPAFNNASQTASDIASKVASEIESKASSGSTSKAPSGATSKAPSGATSKPVSETPSKVANKTSIKTSKKTATISPSDEPVYNPLFSLEDIKIANILSESEFNVALNKLEIQYTNMISALEKKVDAHPTKILRCSKHRKNFQYHIIDNSISPKAKYCKVGTPILGTLAQRDYNREILLKLRIKLAQIKGFKGDFYDSSLDAVYEKRSFGLKKLIKPHFVSTNEYVSVWKAKPYTPNETRAEYLNYSTDNGEKVRSKSEMMIANCLKKHGIPYKYEYPLNLCGFTIHPDFTIINPKTGKIYYWEHLGMMDDRSYSEDACKRLSMYESIGLKLGTDLIITTETSKNPLYNNSIEDKIKLYIE